jgi:hypothetical protein
MGTRRVVATACAAAATLLLAFAAAAGVARAEPRMNACDVQDLWGGFFAGDQSGAAFVTFEIFNQAPPAPEDDDGSADFTLAAEQAAGLGNAGEGDKYHWQFETVLLEIGATAKGHGFLFVPSSTGTAEFVVAGHGEHMAFGHFTLTGGGTVDCLGGEGRFAHNVMVHVQYQDGTEEDGTVPFMGRCDEIEGGCEGNPD